MNFPRSQYDLLRASRMVVFDFIENELPAQITEPVAAFNGSNVRNLLVHTANTYNHWLGNFAMQKEFAYTDEMAVAGISTIRNIYAETDDLVAEFFTQFETALEQPVVNYLRGRELSLTPLQLFTHVLTHEFHHKGQIMTICRLLGHTPPDTDIIRT
jgi:uncharacterized damage-inducible protein DinB